MTSADPIRTAPPVRPTILWQAFNELVVTYPTNDPEPENNSEASKCEPEDIARDLQQVSSCESWLSLFTATDASLYTLAFFRARRHLDVRIGRGSLHRMVRPFVRQGETAFLECAIEKAGEYTEG